MNLKELFGLYVLVNLTLSFSVKKKVKSSLDKLKGKINKRLHNRQGSESFLDINEFEYPGTNDTFRDIHREQWLDYYECLKDRYAETGPEKTIYPTALMALQGTSITLKCGVCISPAEIHTIEMIEWYFNSSSNTSIANEPVELTEHTLVSPDDRSLNMYNVELDQAGEYWCILGDTLAPPYFLHVDNGSEPTRIVRPDQAPKAAHVAPPLLISGYNLKVYSEWTDWTPCSTCDIVGKKVKYGYCTLSLAQGSTHQYVANESAPKLDMHINSRIYKRDDTKIERKMEKGAETETEPHLGANTNTDTESSVKQVDKNDGAEAASLVNTILPIFKNKLPCRSKHTPMKIQDIPEVKARKSEIMVRFCKIKCPRNIVFEVRDKSGNVLESANNSAGIYSMVQGIPDPLPAPTRITFYQTHDSKTVLKCPGNLNTGTPVIWQIGNKVIGPKIIAEQSKGRVYINMMDHLVISKLRFADANIYRHDQELAGTIRLEVTQEIDIKFDHHVVMLGGIAIVSVFLLVFWRAFKGRNRYTKH